MNQISHKFRTLAISLSTFGFGYAVMEGSDRLVDYGHKVFSKAKNIGSLSNIEKLIVRNQPDFLVLQEMNAKRSRRAPRIKALHKQVLRLAKAKRLKVAMFSRTELQAALLSNPTGTKHEMAELLAKKFPDDLALRLPPKRRTWDSEDRRMDIFDAVGLVVLWSSAPCAPKSLFFSRPSIGKG